jgi:hypothetical protein
LVKTSIMKAFKELKQTVKEKIKPTNNAGISSGEGLPEQLVLDIGGMWSASSLNQGIRESLESLSLQKKISKYVKCKLV